MIKISKHSNLNEQTKDILNSYIEVEFGHIPIVKETEWSIPDWTIINFEKDKISTFYNIIEREVFIDGSKIKVAGINNVITPLEYRGKGYATKILQETESFIFEELKCELGILLCADNLIPFYKRLNWYRIDCPVNFMQSDGDKIWRSNTMLLTPKKKQFPKEINLNGLPW